MLEIFGQVRVCMPTAVHVILNNNILVRKKFVDNLDAIILNCELFRGKTPNIVSFYRNS